VFPSDFLYYLIELSAGPICKCGDHCTATSCRVSWGSTVESIHGKAAHQTTKQKWYDLGTHIWHTKFL